MDYLAAFFLNQFSLNPETKAAGVLIAEHVEIADIAEQHLVAMRNPGADNIYRAVGGNHSIGFVAALSLGVAGNVRQRLFREINNVYVELLYDRCRFAGVRNDRPA